MTQPHKITVVGCGVSGLSSGIRLLEAGFEVTIIARDLPPNTTSNAAAAIWYVYEAYPLELAIPWARATFNELLRLSESEEDCGVSMTTAVEMMAHPVDDPWWKDTVRVFQRLSSSELLPGYADGYSVEVPLVEPPVYLPYLMARFITSGGKIEQREIGTLDELYDENHMIVNCTGVYARQVANDEGVYPLRGQVIRVSKMAGVQQTFMDDTDATLPLYIIPRTHDIILGGTLQKDNWDLKVDPATAQDILTRNARIRPDLREADILSHAVGLRPGRKEVRLETERVNENTAVIHNYGHGGAGFTLSWGCADEVARLAVQIRDEP